MWLLTLKAPLSLQALRLSAVPADYTGSQIVALIKAHSIPNKTPRIRNKDLPTFSHLASHSKRPIISPGVSGIFHVVAFCEKFPYRVTTPVC
ncbi:hypothetical protein CEXT_599291 [Caerostris extrusa]|uniref:Uncharacterized protein n=1 Tax=Caerostris extrusa TaxID=172846 RepID=A0AAV4P5Q5_CAEEX|nr:hypothetical protein CEXT_599291 [Caerostris extrusa]